jgi:hypothetical protein
LEEADMEYEKPAVESREPVEGQLGFPGKGNPGNPGNPGGGMS